MIRAKARYDIVRRRSYKKKVGRSLIHRGLGLLLVLFCFGVFSYTRAGAPTRVEAAVSSTLNFQARLYGSGGSTVADGTYSIEFNLYTASSGGTNEWAETQASVVVKNGYFSVQLGSVTPFGSGIDWSQEKWLTMNVNSDGEMNPRLKLTGVPYSFRSGQADSLTDGSSTLTAGDLLHKAPLSIQSVNAAVAGLRFNQTGAGGLVQLQGDGADVFTVSKTGNAVLAGTLDIDGATLDIGSASQSGGLVLSDGSSNTGTLQTAALGQNTVYTLPDPGGGSATICLSTGNCGGTGDISQGGNNFGTAVTIGSNDTFDLNLETDGITRLTLDASGNATFAGQIFASNGSASSPAYSFTNDTDGGLFTNGTDTVYLINGANSISIGSTFVSMTNASNSLSLTSNAVLFNTQVNNTYVGTNSTPAYQIGILDQDTGFYQAAGGAGTWSFASNGTQTIRLGNGITVFSGGANITGGIDNNSGGITEAGSITGVGTNITGTGALTLASGGTSALTLDSASNTLIIAATDTGLQRAAAGTYTIDLNNAGATTLALNNTGAGAASLNLVDGTLQVAGTTVLTNGRVLQNVTANTSILTAGTLGVARGGTGISSTPTNGQLLIGNGTGYTLATLTAGSGVGIANASGGVTISTTLGASVGNSEIDADAVTLGTQTSGDYIANLGTLSGLSTSGNSGEGSTPALSVLYGSTANTAVEGDTTLICPSGTGNLTGGGNSITLGTGGTCNALDTNAAVTFSTSVTTPILTSSSGLMISSGGTSSITLNSASNTTIIDASDTTLQRTAAGSYAIDLADAGTTGLIVTNSGAGAADLNIAEGSLQMAGTAVLTNSRALQNLTGISTTGGLVFNSFGGSTGLLSVDGSGNVSVAAAGTGYEVPLTFNNGLTRTGNTVAFGGSLTANTTLALGSNNLTISGAGNMIVGSTTNIGGDTTPGGLFSVGSLSQFQVSSSGVITAPTSTDTINGLIINSGSLSGITGFAQASGNFSMSGSGTFGTGTGAVSLNGATSVTGSNTFSVGSGLTTLSGGLTATGVINLNTTGTASTNIGNGSGSVTLNGSGIALNTSLLTRTAAGTTTFNLGDASDTTLTLTNIFAGVANLNIAEGGLQTAGVTRLTNGGVLQNVTADTAILTSGLLPVARGGTGAGTFATNGVVFGNGTSALQVTAAGTSGQVLLANGSGVPTFTSLSGDMTVNASGVVAIGSDRVALGTDTTGNYIATITVGNGLTVSGVGVETATASLNLDVTTTGTTATTSSNSGLELTTAGLSLFRGCSNGQVMEWNGGSDVWNCATDNTGLSDSTIKTNVANLGSVLDQIKNIDVVEFNFKCNDALWLSYEFTCDDQTGVLAQDLALTFPDLVSLRPDGLNQVNFGRLNFYTLKAVSELANFIQADGDALLNSVSTNGTLRLTSGGALQNINGLTIVSGGASISGGIDNNSGGITETGAIAGATTLNASGLATLSGGATISGGTINLNASGLLTNTNINTGVSTGTVTIGGGTAALVINSTAFDVSSTGALSGITTLNASGLITGSGGLTATGTINLNVNSLLTNTNIGTGTSTGTVTIGGGLSPLIINSTNFDVSSAGAVSGVTTLSASNQISTGTGVTVSGLAGISAGTCGNTQYLGGLRVTGGVITDADVCRGVGLSDARLKENVTDLTPVLDKVKGVRTVTFDFKCDDPAFESMNEACQEGKQTGVIAQELAQVFPELVYQDEFGYYRVKYEALNIYTLKAVGELAEKVDTIDDSPEAGEVKTGGVLRLDSSGVLQNITGLNLVGGGASVVGGIDNNGGGITETGEIKGVTRLSGESIKLTASTTGNMLTLVKDAQNVFTVFNNGALELRLDAANAFGVKRADGQDIFSISTEGGLVRIGSLTGDDDAVLLVLDNLNIEGDPEGVNGAQYYNSNINRFRCFENGRWQDCLPATNAEYVLTSQVTTWNQPAEDQEFPGSPRTWVDLTNARNYRMLLQLSAPGTSFAACYMQYATANDGPWQNLAQPGGYLSIDEAGALKSEWAAITPDARKEVLVRVMCRGGNYTSDTDAQATKPEFSSIRLQIR